MVFVEFRFWFETPLVAFIAAKLWKGPFVSFDRTLSGALDHCFTYERTEFLHSYFTQLLKDRCGHAGMLELLEMLAFFCILYEEEGRRRRTITDDSRAIDTNDDKKTNCHLWRHKEHQNIRSD